MNKLSTNLLLPLIAFTLLIALPLSQANTMRQLLGGGLSYNTNQAGYSSSSGYQSNSQFGYARPGWGGGYGPGYGGGYGPGYGGGYGPGYGYNSNYGSGYQASSGGYSGSSLGVGFGIGR